MKKVKKVDFLKRQVNRDYSGGEMFRGREYVMANGIDSITIIDTTNFELSS